MKELKLTDREWCTLRTAVYIVRDMQAKAAKSDRQARPNTKGKLSSEINLQRINKIAKLLEGEE